MSGSLFSFDLASSIASMNPEFPPIGAFPGGGSAGDPPHKPPESPPPEPSGTGSDPHPTNVSGLPPSDESADGESQICLTVYEADGEGVLEIPNKSPNAHCRNIYVHIKSRHRWLIERLYFELVNDGPKDGDPRNVGWRTAAWLAAHSDHDRGRPVRDATIKKYKSQIVRAVLAEAFKHGVTVALPAIIEYKKGRGYRIKPGSLRIVRRPRID